LRQVGRALAHLGCRSCPRAGCALALCASAHARLGIKMTLGSKFSKVIFLLREFWSYPELTPGDAVLDFLGSQINFAVNRAVGTAALLRGHQFCVIHCGIEVIETFFNVALETRWQGRVFFQGIADSLRTSLDGCAMASKGSQLVSGDTGLLRAAFFYLLATGDDRAVEQWQQQRRGGTRSASVTLDIIGVKAARAQLL